MLSDFRFYYSRYGVSFLFDFGFQALILYRIGRWSFLNRRVVNPFWYVYLVLKGIHKIFVKIELPPTSSIGKNLLLPHPYGLVVGGLTTIGDNCTIGPWVVIGRMGKGKGNPSIKDRVYIGTKATILGPVTVGSGAIIGAHAFVIKDVPDGKKVYGTVSKYSE
jgi:serine O-acetyltransferase